MRTGLACLVLTTACLPSPGQPDPPRPGNFTLSTREATAGPVHPDWPLIAVAEIAPIRHVFGPKVGQDLADRFADPPRLDPPGASRLAWGRVHGFYLAGPPGHPDDRFELTEVARDGRRLTATVEGWRTGRPHPAEGGHRPAQVVTLYPPLDAGGYELTVVWREFVPRADGSPFWDLRTIRRAAAGFTVRDGPPPAGTKAAGVTAGDFRPAPAGDARAGRGYIPTPAAARVQSIAHFDGYAGRWAAGVAAGTFDPAAWQRGLYGNPTPEDWRAFRVGPARAAPVRPARPGDPVFAVVYAPEEVNGDHCRVRAVEWTGRGYVLHVQFFHTGPQTGSNTYLRSAYIVPLPAPEVGGRRVIGPVPVEVRWVVLHRQSEARDGVNLRPEGLFSPLEPDTEAAWFGLGWDRASRCELRIEP
ncbi:hypothetical protein J0H58_38700 [bacterium]|nr:hypothetical protein [bacterium]